MDILTVIGSWIRTARIRQGISQEALGEKTGLSSNYISLVERGHKQVTIITLEKITEALGMDLAAIFENYQFKEANPSLDKEIRSLVELARSMSPEDLKALRRVIEHFSKNGNRRKK